MAERTFTWHYPEPNTPLPAFYVDEDYEKAAVRIHADTAPDVGDCQVDIFCDGVSIFNNHATNYIYVKSTMRPHSDPASTTVCLPKGQTEEPTADDFTEDMLSEGSWLTCVVGPTNGAKNITIHLEVNGVEDTVDDK